MNVLFGIVGLIGAALIIIASIVGITTNKPYSPLTHMVSQLGRSSSNSSSFFNIALVLSGLCFGILTVGVALRFPDVELRAVLAIIAIISGIAGMCVGFVPSSTTNTAQSQAHLIIAIIFFLLSAVFVGVFAGLVIGDNGAVYPEWLGFIGIAPPLVAGIMLTAGIVKIISKNMVWSRDDITDGSTPTIMIMPSTEWLYIVLLNIWVICISIFLLT